MAFWWSQGGGVPAFLFLSHPVTGTLCLAAAPEQVQGDSGQARGCGLCEGWRWPHEHPKHTRLGEGTAVAILALITRPHVFILSLTPQCDPADTSSQMGILGVNLPVPPGDRKPTDAEGRDPSPV